MWGDGVGDRPELGDRISFTGESVVELHHGALHIGGGHGQLDESIDQVGATLQVLEPLGKIQPEVTERGAAPRLVAEMRERRVAGVHRDSQLHGQGAFEVRAVEAGHVSCVREPDQSLQLVEPVRPGEDLLGQWGQRVVPHRQELKSVPGVASRYPGEEMQVVVDNRRVEGGGCDIDELGARELEEHEQTEHSLLVVHYTRDLGQVPHVEAHRGNHDHGARRLGVGEHFLVDPGEALLQVGECGILLRATRAGKQPRLVHESALCVVSTRLSLLLPDRCEGLWSHSSHPVAWLADQRRWMIELIEGLGTGVVGARAVGEITAEDYESTLIPAVDAALAVSERIRMLYVLGSEFEGYEAEAALDDARMGLQHWSDFERIAVVTDNGSYRTAIKGFGFLMPGEVRVYSVDELDAAKDWITS